jgi:hypothetical protein
MRHFQTLDKITIDSESGVLYLSTEKESESFPRVGMRREGIYIAISASYGPLEIALRPRLEDLINLLSRLQPVEGLQTTRQVGTSQAYLAIGLRSDGALVMRPTIVADATGLFAYNLVVTQDITKAFFEWLPVNK